MQNKLGLFENLRLNKYKQLTSDLDHFQKTATEYAETNSKLWEKQQRRIQRIQPKLKAIYALKTIGRSPEKSLKAQSTMKRSETVVTKS